MAYPTDKEDFTPVVTPEFVRDNHINELQTLLETLQDILGLFPNWDSAPVEDIGEMFITKVLIELQELRANSGSGLDLTDDGSNYGILIADGGNVAIKDADPTYPLTVNGEIVSSYGFYHDRGNATDNDWSQATLTSDGNYHELDLSSIVPADTKAVSIRIHGADNSVNSSFHVRHKGWTNNVNQITLNTSVANIGDSEVGALGIDSDLKIEYRAENVGWINFGIRILGWWK